MTCNNCGARLKEGEVYFCTLCSIEEMYAYDPYAEHINREIKGIREE